VLDGGSTKDRYETLIIIKNAVIGSNRQKAVLFYNDVIPHLLNIAVSRRPDELDIKLNALIILGSLARALKGRRIFNIFIRFLSS